VQHPRRCHGAAKQYDMQISTWTNGFPGTDSMRRSTKEVFRVMGCPPSAERDVADKMVPVRSQVGPGPS
jgi:hypothetical protein